MEVEQEVEGMARMAAGAVQRDAPPLHHLVPP